MITKKEAQKYLDLALSSGGDFAEIFLEETYSSNYSMINGEIEAANSGTITGAGIRIYQGYQSVYGYTSDLSDTAMHHVIESLASAWQDPQQVYAKELQQVIYKDQHPVKKPVQLVSAQQKKALMKRANDAVLGYDPVIQKALIHYMDERRQITLFNSDGKMIQDDQTRTRLRIQAVAIEGDLMEDSYDNPGAHKGFEFYDEIDVEAHARRAAASAKTMLHAKDCPSGEMTVVIDNGFGGVIFHEACGHSLEATSVAKGASVFSGKLGERIASDLVNAVDDGTLPGAWGSNNIDDEGNFTQRNVLIENGILKGYLVDTLNGRRMNMKSSGSARRQNYSFEPTSRMSNTFILNGSSTFDEIIKATKKGLYAKKLGGGSVSPASGEFNFACTEAYLIEDGKITEPVKGATLVGNGADILFRIDMIANNGSTEQGVCGSRSGNVPTDVGQPTLRISKMTVGGKGGKQE